MEGIDFLSGKSMYVRSVQKDRDDNLPCSDHQFFFSKKIKISQKPLSYYQGGARRLTAWRLSSCGLFSALLPAYLPSSVCQQPSGSIWGALVVLYSKPCHVHESTDDEKMVRDNLALTDGSFKVLEWSTGRLRDWDWDSGARWLRWHLDKDSSNASKWQQNWIQRKKKEKGSGWVGCRNIEIQAFWSK